MTEMPSDGRQGPVLILSALTGHTCGRGQGALWAVLEGLTHEARLGLLQEGHKQVTHQLPGFI